MTDRSESNTTDSGGEKVPQWVTTWPDWYGPEFSIQNVTVVPKSDYDAVARALAEAQAENKQWRTWGIVEIAVRNPRVMEYMSHWENRTLKAEAALSRVEKEREALMEYGIAKIMAMTDEQVSALAAFNGRNPEDQASIARQAVEIVLLKDKLARVEAETPSAAQRPGMVSVPKEPTPEMLGAGINASWKGLSPRDLAAVYKAMLAAAKEER